MRIEDTYSRLVGGGARSPGGVGRGEGGCSSAGARWGGEAGPLLEGRGVPHPPLPPATWVGCPCIMSTL